MKLKFLTVSNYQCVFFVFIFFTIWKKARIQFRSFFERKRIPGKNAALMFPFFRDSGKLQRHPKWWTVPGIQFLHLWIVRVCFVGGWLCLALYRGDVMLRTSFFVRPHHSCEHPLKIGAQPPPYFQPEKIAALTKPSDLVTWAVVDGQEGTFVPWHFMSIATPYLEDLTSLVKHEVRFN